VTALTTAVITVMRSPAHVREPLFSSSMSTRFIYSCLVPINKENCRTASVSPNHKLNNNNSNTSEICDCVIFMTNCLFLISATFDFATFCNFSDFYKM